MLTFTLPGDSLTVGSLSLTADGATRSSSLEVPVDADGLARVFWILGPRANGEIALSVEAEADVGGSLLTDSATVYGEAVYRGLGIDRTPNSNPYSFVPCYEWKCQVAARTVGPPRGISTFPRANSSSGGPRGMAP